MFFDFCVCTQRNVFLFFLQMGGDFMLDDEGRVIFRYPCKNPLDRPSLEQILQAKVWKHRVIRVTRRWHHGERTALWPALMKSHLALMKPWWGVAEAQLSGKDLYRLFFSVMLALCCLSVCRNNKPLETKYNFTIKQGLTFVIVELHCLKSCFELRKLMNGLTFTFQTTQ